MSSCWLAVSNHLFEIFCRTSVWVKERTVCEDFHVTLLVFVKRNQQQSDCNLSIISEKCVWAGLTARLGFMRRVSPAPTVSVVLVSKLALYEQMWPFVFSICLSWCSAFRSLMEVLKRVQTDHIMQIIHVDLIYYWWESFLIIVIWLSCWSEMLPQSVIIMKRTIFKCFALHTAYPT